MNFVKGIWQLDLIELATNKILQLTQVLLENTEHFCKRCSGTDFVQFEKA